VLLMGQKCTVCEHPRRAEIELGIARRVGYRQISQKFGPSIWALHRHRHGHMPPALMVALETTALPTVVDLDALRKSESEGLLQTLVVQRGRLFQLLDEAEAVGDIKAAAAVHGRIMDNVTIVAKLLGDLSTHSVTTVNTLLVAPEYLSLRSALVTALRPYPEARKAVSAVLQGLEGQTPHQTGIPMQKLERADG
jgi:hypothetical protein